MNREAFIESIKEKFKESITGFTDRSPKRVFFEIDPRCIKELTKYLFYDVKARFNIATGVDTRFHIEVLYHFTVEKLRLILSFRTKLDREKPSIDSITPLIKGAEWIEREMHELIGIDFIGHPNLKPLLLPEDWPKGVYPLRRDYKEWDENAIRDRGV